MRFMMLMIPKVYQQQDVKADFVPDAKAVGAMMKFNKQLREAGALITLDGLHPPSSGARVTYNTGKPVVTDGPFAEAREVLGGYWIIQAASRAEAIEWARRIPAQPGDVVEVRQVHEFAEFPPEIQKLAAEL